MALNKSTFLIRDYENIRRILRDVYIYGCFSKEDYVEKFDISERKYEKEQQRISAYLPDGFIHKDYVNKKVQLSCSYSSLDSAENYLADTYRNKSFTELDVTAYFLVQQVLHKHGELTLSELLDKMPYVGSNVRMFTKENLWDHLGKLQELGLVCCRKDENKVVYSVSEERFACFETEELQELCTYLAFMKNVSPLEMPYHYLHKKLKLYLQLNRNVKEDDAEVVQFKHNHLFNLLDNDIMLELLKAIRMKKTVELVRYGFPKEDVLEVIPAEILHDSTYGRQYLCARRVGGHMRRVFRLDRIRKVVCGRDLTEEEIEIAAQLREASEKCWCTSNGREQEVSEIVVEFRFQEEKEEFILRRIQAEGHGGCLQRKESGVYEYRLKVFDPDEMIPWIRSFGERAKVISGGLKQTEQKLAEEWKKAVAKYEAL